MDVDDVDDRVLRADPHLALLRHHHAVLRGPRREQESSQFPVFPAVGSVLYAHSEAEPPLRDRQA